MKKLYLLIPFLLLVINACATSGVKISDTLPGQPDWYKDYENTDTEFYSKGTVRADNPTNALTGSTTVARSEALKNYGTYIRDETTIDDGESNTLISSITEDKIVGAEVVNQATATIIDKEGKVSYYGYALVRVDLKESLKRFEDKVKLEKERASDIRRKEQLEKLEKRIEAERISKYGD